MQRPSVNDALMLPQQVCDEAEASIQSLDSKSSASHWITLAKAKDIM